MIAGVTIQLRPQWCSMAKKRNFNTQSGQDCWRDLRSHTATVAATQRMDQLSITKVCRRKKPEAPNAFSYFDQALGTSVRRSHLALDHIRLEAAWSPCSMRHSKTGVLHAEGDTGFASYCSMLHLYERQNPFTLEMQPLPFFFSLL